MTGGDCMRHEQRYPFTHLFGFAGLTVDETVHSIAGWLRDFQMPYLMPHVWHAMLALAFAVGGVIGCAIAVWMLAVRGLI